MTERSLVLEDELDRLGLRAILEVLADICQDKATHLEENWQDRITAKEWDKDARKLLTLAEKVSH